MRVIGVILCIVGSLLLNVSIAQEDAELCTAENSEIAYLLENGGVRNLYIMNADGTVPRLFGTNVTDYQWSPDGTKMAVAITDMQSRESLIQIIEFETNSVYQISREQVEIFNTRWSPDGTQIAFNSGAGSNLQVFVADANGENIRQLTTQPVDHFIGDWSPDGTQIATVVFGASGSQLALVDVSTGDFQYVAAESLIVNVFVEFVSWTPDSSSILFNSNLSSGSELQLHIVFTDNDVLRRLVAQQAFGVRWTSDNTRFLYTSRDLNTTNVNLFMMDWRTGEINQLNQDFAIIHEGLFAPSWSPDDTSFIFERFNNDNYDLFVMSADGSSLRQLTDTPNNESNPQWRPCLQN